MDAWSRGRRKSLGRASKRGRLYRSKVDPNAVNQTSVLTTSAYVSARFLRSTVTFGGKSCPDTFGSMSAES